MDEQLSLLAELTVALAGFSAIIVVFRRRDNEGSWQPEDIYRFRIMIQFSLFGALFAIAPAALTGLGLSPDTAIRFASACLTIYLITTSVLMWRKFMALPPGSLSIALARAITAGSILVTCVAFLNTFALLPNSGREPYVTLVSWLLIAAGLMFYRLVMAPIVQEDT